MFVLNIIRNGLDYGDIKSYVINKYVYQRIATNQQQWMTFQQQPATIQQQPILTYLNAKNVIKNINIDSDYGNIIKNVKQNNIMIVKLQMNQQIKN